MQTFVTDSAQLSEQCRRAAVREIGGAMRTDVDMSADYRRTSVMHWSLEAVQKATRLDYRPLDLDDVKAHARAVWRRIAADPVSDHICRECGTRFLPRSGGRCPCVLGS